ncbi:MAG TPA: hypothetical protein VHJ39_00090 [Solirubrobacteraceae bacterium]|jgi:hypothetical protein|nr:hypothetical protein [Solirubrobacteraceae bacterium]
MADEPTAGGWLPPSAPGSRPAPQFEPAPPDPEPEPEPEPEREAVAAWGTPRDRPVFQPAARSSQPNGLATTSLVLGIVGILLVIFAPLSIPVSVAAWITGAQSRKRVAAGITDQGEGSARGGVILGITGVVLGLLVVATWIVLVALGVDLEELRRDLERRSSS